MVDLSMTEILVENSLRIDPIESDDVALLATDNPSSTPDQEKRNKIIIRSLTISSIFIMTIAVTTLMIFFVAKKQYSTLSIVDNKSTKLTEYTTSVPIHRPITIGNLSMLWIPDIPENATWAQNGVTVAGGQGIGSGTDALASPLNVVFDDDKQTLVIADSDNHRVVEWKIGATNGQVVAGENGKGSGLGRLNAPIGLAIDKEMNNLIICDSGNRRVIQWSRRSGTTEGELVIDNIDCYGLAMDDQRYLYIADSVKCEVRRYEIGDKNGIVVAGGNDVGDDVNQLGGPSFIFVDQYYSVYVSDEGNNRVMKWKIGATEGIVVARVQLVCPRGLFVDKSGILYVSEQSAHLVSRWPQETKRGTIIAGGHDWGYQADQLHDPSGISFDRDGNLYVADQMNHRVQRFSIKQV